MASTTKRKNLSKRTRFEVFKRDHFTCQYCGAQPPAVTLVIDHIHPIAAGGDNGADNLVTACEPCNAGKSDKLLSKVPIRPDADLLYLETQQEISEIRRYRESIDELREARLELVEALQSEFCVGAGVDWMPGDTFLMDALGKFEYTIVSDAVKVLARAALNRKVSHWNWEKYFWGICHTARREMEGDNGAA